MKLSNVARFPILIVLVLMLAALPFCALSESGATMFVPESMVSAYNDAIVPFLGVVGLETDTARQAEPLFKLELQSQADGKIVYANSDSTVVLTYTADSPNAEASEFTLWSNLGDESKWKNIPSICFAYTALTNSMDGVGPDFFDWVNVQKDDGSTFELDAFSGHYAITPFKECCFTFTRK